jgi:hypothetical protein
VNDRKVGMNVPPLLLFKTKQIKQRKSHISHIHTAVCPVILVERMRNLISLKCPSMLAIHFFTPTDKIKNKAERKSMIYTK